MRLGREMKARDGIRAGTYGMSVDMMYCEKPVIRERSSRAHKLLISYLSRAQIQNRIV